jgi:hypothetical protein
MRQHSQWLVLSGGRQRYETGKVMTIAGARAPEIQLSSRRAGRLPFTVSLATAKLHLRLTIFPCRRKKKSNRRAGLQNTCAP